MFQGRTYWLIAAGLLAILPVLSHAQTKVDAETKPKEISAAAPYKAGGAGSFLSSRFAKSQQDLGKASELADETLKVAPKQETFLLDAIRVHVLAGNIDKAFKLLNDLPEVSRREPMIAMLLSVQHFEAQKFDDAMSALKETSDTGLLGVVKPAMIGWIQLAKQEGKPPVPNQATSIEKSGFFAPFMHYQQALMYQVAAQPIKALEHMQLAVSDPATAPFRVVDMQVRMMASANDLAAAQKTASLFNAANPDAVFTIAVPNALPDVRPIEIVDARSGLAELFFTTASILFGEEISAETLAYLRLALHLRPNFPPAQFMLAHVYEQQKDHARAIKVYDSIRSGNVFHERGQLRKALNLEAMGDYKQAAKLLDSWAEIHPDDISALITKGDMLREQKRYEDAIAMYSRVLLRVKTPAVQHWPIYYTRGICYERTGQWKRAEADFKQALALEPDQPDVLNYLAYSWLTMGKNLKQAREYLQIAVEARPDDAHIIDSMGWAHYIAGNFDKAVDYLERAIEITPEDAAINDHLGDAYWRTGRVLEARYQWQRALKNKPDSDLKKSLTSKIAGGLPPFLRQRGTNQLSQPEVIDGSKLRESGTLPLTP